MSSPQFVLFKRSCHFDFCFAARVAVVANAPFSTEVFQHRARACQCVYIEDDRPTVHHMTPCMDGLSSSMKVLHTVVHTVLGYTL